MTLRLPVTSTTLAASRPVISTKLTYAAVKELLTIAEDCEALNALSAKPDLEASSTELQQQISDELSSILQEVLNEQIRTSESNAPTAQGTHLHPTINSPSGPLQSGKPAPPVRAAAASHRSRLEAAGH